MKFYKWQNNKKEVPRPQKEWLLTISTRKANAEQKHTHPEKTARVCSSEDLPKSPVEFNPMTTAFLTLQNGSGQHRCF